MIIVLSVALGKQVSKKQFSVVCYLRALVDLEEWFPSRLCTLSVSKTNITTNRMCRNWRLNRNPLSQAWAYCSKAQCQPIAFPAKKYFGLMLNPRHTELIASVSASWGRWSNSVIYPTPFRTSNPGPLLQVVKIKSWCLDFYSSQWYVKCTNLIRAPAIRQLTSCCLTKLSQMVLPNEKFRTFKGWLDRKRRPK